MALLSILTGLVGLGNSVTGIAAKIADVKMAQAAALTDREKVAADERIKALEAQRDVVIAASANDKWWSTRELIGKIVLVYVFKIIVWDTVFQWGVTPNPGQQVTYIVMTVIGFYFLSRSAEKITSSIASAWGRR